MDEHDGFWETLGPPVLQEPGVYSEGVTFTDDLQEDVHNRMPDWLRQIRPYVHGKRDKGHKPGRVKVNRKPKITRFRTRKALFAHLGFDTNGASEKTETLWLIQEPGRGFSVSRFNPRKSKP